MLDANVNKALKKINFVDRYEKLSEQYSNDNYETNGQVIKVDKTIVLKIFSELGYNARYNSREHFYWIHEQENNLIQFGFKLGLKYGIAELIWEIREDDKLILGTPWNVYSREMINENYIIKPPLFGTYEDIKGIAAIALEMYEDFKIAYMEL